MLKIPPIHQQERRWLQRKESIKFCSEKNWTEINMTSSNLLTVPLFVSKNEELHSVRYTHHTQICLIGTNTNYTEYHDVLILKIKCGFIVILTNKKIVYRCMHSDDTIEFNIIIKYPIVSLDGLLDMMYNKHVTVFGDTTDHFHIFNNGVLTNKIFSTTMIDLFSFGGAISWHSPESVPIIYDVHFLWVINRWMIETSEYVFILDKEGYLRFMECRSNVMYELLNEKNDYDGMVYDYDQNAIYITKNQEYIYYQKNGYILIAKTTYPYHIKFRMNEHTRQTIHYWCEKHDSFDMFFHTSTHRYKLSMFPM